MVFEPNYCTSVQPEGHFCTCFLVNYAGEAGHPARFKSLGLKIAIRTITLLLIFMPIRRAFKVMSDPGNLSFYTSLLPLWLQESLVVRIIVSLVHCVVIGTRYDFSYYVFTVQFVMMLMATTMLRITRYG